jgi:hypothetical protein
LFFFTGALAMSQVENWRNKGIPPKKRGESYYARPYPELELRLRNTFESKLKPIQNGGSVHLKPKRVGKILISLNNTCAVDALVHLYAAAYCDCQHFRHFADGSDSALLKLAVHLASEGLNPKACQMRAELLYEDLRSDAVEVRFGMVSINCAQTPSHLVRKLKLPPSLIDNQTCSSQLCPGQLGKKRIPCLAARSDVLKADGISSLQRAVEENDIPTVSLCRRPFADEQIAHLPSEAYNLDKSLSEHALCAGIVAHRYDPQQAIFISVVGADTVTLGRDDLSATEIPLQCALKDVPVRLNVHGAEYILRGVLAYNPPVILRHHNFRNVGLGHYFTYSRRIGGKWDLFDDQRKKQEPIKEETIANLDLLLYTKSF